MIKRSRAAKRSRARLAARSLDVPVEAAGLVEAFFRPLDALGSSPGLIARWLKKTGIGEGHRVLDLGCGKGAVAVAVARATGCRVLGVDAFEPFVLSCRGLASVRGVGPRCEFRVGLAERFRSRPFDAVVMLNLFPFERAIGIARRLTRPGGWYVIDDAVAVGRGDARTHFPSAEEAVGAIESAGDRVVRCKVWTKAEVHAGEGGMYDRLSRHAAKLANANPKAGPMLAECLRRQRAGIADLSGAIRPACWLVKRGRR